MPNFNKVIIAGHLTRDVEVKYTAGGTAVTNGTVATTRKYKNEEETAFVDVTFWGKTAELLGQYCGKGSAILVEGRLKQDSWEDKETGQKRSKMGVVCESMQFLGGKGSGNNSRGEESQTTPAWRNEPVQDEDVPF